MSDANARQGLWSNRWLGKPFVHPVFDFALIGGGLSLAVALVLYVERGQPDFELVPAASIPLFLLFSNNAHFAASTVRLYTKPGAFDRWPLLTMYFPLLALLVLVGCLFSPGALGEPLRVIYLTWSPYHYAAQAYGLAVMYSFRSGRRLESRDKHMLWLICLAPFLFNVTYGKSAAFQWLGRVAGKSDAALFATLDAWQPAIVVIAYLLPLTYFVVAAFGRGGALPLISMVIVFTNTVWWLALQQLDAFTWATIFHGLQYLAIVVIFHLKDQVAQAEGDPPPRFVASQALRFYGMCLALGYALFQCLPLAFRWSGFGLVESYLLVTATINIHHFIVDAYIWKLGSDQGNRRIVEAGAISA